VTVVQIDTLMAELKKGLTKPQWDELLLALDIAGKAKTKDQAVEKVRLMLNSQLEMHFKARGFERN
jgi:hypothetical protein